MEKEEFLQVSEKLWKKEEDPHSVQGEPPEALEHCGMSRNMKWLISSKVPTSYSLLCCRKKLIPW